MGRRSIHSNYPLKYLSPASKAERVSKLSKECKNLVTKLSRCRHLDFNLNDKHHSRLLELVHLVSERDGDVIEGMCSKGDQVLLCDENPLREVWYQDVTERLQYERDQRKNGMCMFFLKHLAFVLHLFRCE